MSRTVKAFFVQNLVAWTILMAAELTFAADFSSREAFSTSLPVEDELGKGEVTAVITETPRPDEYDNILVSKSMMIQRFDSDGNVIWKVRDFVNDCIVYPELDLLAPVSVTDLNNNGLAEIWMPYKLSCRGDVSPSDMKIIMYEGKKKHAMRGSMTVPVTDSRGSFIGGDYKMDDAMKKSHPKIREHALKLWKKLNREF